MGLCKMTSLVCLCVVLVVVVGANREAEDCELMNLAKGEVFNYKTFNESVRFSVYPTEDMWSIEANVTDMDQTECTLGIQRNGDNKIVSFKCSNSFFHNKTLTTKDNIFLRNVWTEFTLLPNPFFDDSIRRHNVTSLSVIFNQLLIFGDYVPFNAKQLTLRPPLKIQWKQILNSNVVFNCIDKACFLNSSTFIVTEYDQRKPFYVKPGVGFTGLNITTDPVISSLQDITVPNVGSSKINWKKVTVVSDKRIIEVLVDGKEVKRAEMLETTPNLILKTVQTLGEGLLTWCDPRPPTCIKEGTTLTPWVVVAILVIIIVLLLVCLYYRHRIQPITSPNDGKAPSAETNISTEVRPVNTIAQVHRTAESNPYSALSTGADKSVHANVQYRANGCRRSGHDSDNSLYGEF